VEGVCTALSTSAILTNGLSAVELVGKMADPQFSRRARSADFVVHAWETLRAAGGDSGDRVLGTAIDVFALLVSRDPRDLTDLTNRGNLVPTLFQRLETMTRKNDPLFILNGAENDTELKRKGFGRTDKTPVRSPWTTLSVPWRAHESPQLSNLNRIVVRSNIFPEGTPVSV